MNRNQKRKMVTVIITLSLLGLATALITYALRQNISLFYTPEQIFNGEAPLEHVVRVGGMVVPGSIEHSKKDLTVSFKITDYKQIILVTYTGILPDLFRENQGVVALGKIIDTQHFTANQILAKHDENYMPPEVKAAIAKSLS